MIRDPIVTDINNYKGVEEIDSILDEFYSPDEQKQIRELSEGLPCYRGQTYSSMAMLMFKKMRIMYSRGDSKDNLRLEFKNAFNLLWEGEFCFRDTCDEQKERPSNTPVLLAAFVIMQGLGYGVEVIKRFIACTRVDFDQFLDLIFLQYYPGRPVVESIYEPKKYAKIVKLINTPKEKQPVLIKKYLDTWAKTLGRSGPEGASPRHLIGNYDGSYLCYEAAAVVLAFGIDDSLFRDHIYYPTELMQWCDEGEKVDLILPLEKMTIPEYGTTKSSSEMQADNIANLVVSNYELAPESLSEHFDIFEIVCEHVPLAVKQCIWNAMVQKYWNDFKKYGFFSVLNETAYKVSYHQYGYLVLLQVDWKDLDSAMTFGQSLMREHGLSDVDAQSTELFDCKSIPEYFKTIDHLLQPHGFRFVEISDGTDNYTGLIATKKISDQLVDLNKYQDYELRFPS
jgi:hypothetical protein